MILDDSLWMQYWTWLWSPYLTNESPPKIVLSESSELLRFTNTLFLRIGVIVYLAI